MSTRVTGMTISNLHLCFSTSWTYGTELSYPRNPVGTRSRLSVVPTITIAVPQPGLSGAASSLISTAAALLPRDGPLEQHMHQAAQWLAELSG